MLRIKCLRTALLALHWYPYRFSNCLTTKSCLMLHEQNVFNLSRIILSPKSLISSIRFVQIWNIVHVVCAWHIIHYIQVLCISLFLKRCMDCSTVHEYTHVYDLMQCFKYMFVSSYIKNNFRNSFMNHCKYKHDFNRVLQITSFH